MLLRIVEVRVENYRAIKDRLKEILREYGLNAAMQIYKDERVLDVMWFGKGKMDKVVGTWWKGKRSAGIVALDYGSGIAEKIGMLGEVLGEQEREQDEKDWHMLFKQIKARIKRVEDLKIEDKLELFRRYRL